MKWRFGSVLILFFVFLFLMNCNKNVAEPNNETASIPSHQLNDAGDLDSLVQQIGNARVVLLGEASHGTAEYYEWRAAISKRLIEEKGFTIIGVEGEWADSYRVNQFVKGPLRDSAQAVSILKQYDRWPTWMWGNYEVASLITWMNRYNQGKAETGKAGLFGLDVYCLWESMQELMPLIQGNDSLTAMAQKVQQCFRPFSADPGEYAQAVATASTTCRSETQRLWQAINSYTGGSTGTNEATFLMQQNALVALNGENYYRSSVSSYPGSWNVRDQHMTQTIKRLLEWHGPQSKIIVWEHNTHVGDARYTDMAAGGMVNVGQLVREEYGQNNVYIVGFGSYKGTVIAAGEWGGAIERMNVPAAKKGSWEDLLHQQGAHDKILFSSELKQNEALMKPIGHRAIGVVYNPARESGNYVPSVIPNRYDAFIYIDQTKALSPLGTTPKNEPPDTYPSGY
jgi:erythromycin esterase-like protein